MNPRLVAHSGPRKGQTISLTENEIVVGREASAGLCLADLSVSRYHCRIRSEDGQLQIVDLESLNGTFVNGLPVSAEIAEAMAIRSELATLVSLWSFTMRPCRPR